MAVASGAPRQRGETSGRRAGAIKEAAPLPSGPMNEPAGLVGYRNLEYRDPGKAHGGGRDQQAGNADGGTDRGAGAGDRGELGSARR